MGVDRRLDASLARAGSLQAHICGRADTLELPEEPKLLVREMREHLISASDEGLLETPAHDIFELCFPPSAPDAERLPRFVRFDLNQPGHDNESIGLRSHLHPGHDDIRAPAPLMSPLELLDLLVAGLPVPERPRKA